MNDSAGTPGTDELASLVGRVVGEYQERLDRGERPDVEDLARRHPQVGDLLRRMLPALQMVRPPDSATPPTAPPVDPAPPAAIGEYRILREVGRGGMGVVYEAVQEQLGRHVALKVLPFRDGTDATLLERFRREARAVARLHHTNIVPVFGVGEQGGTHYYAMQLIRGRSLDAILRELRDRGSLRGLSAPPKASDTAPSEGHPAPATLAEGHPAARNGSSVTRGDAARPSPSQSYYQSVARVGLQAAEALAYAHGQGILHRDVKPSNLLLDEQGTAWLTDFGLAKAEGLDDLTHTGDVVGTLRYLPPERLRGHADARGDLYSLGLTLYEMLTLRPACDAPDRGRLIRQIADEEPPRPRKLDPHIPRDLETIVVKAMAKEPGHRYPSAAALAEDLRRFLADRPVAARRVTLPERLWRWCRRNPAVAVPTALAVLLFLTGFALVSWQWLRAERSWDRAETNLARARRAVEGMLTRVADQRLRHVPQMEDVRRQLLEDALKLNREFLAESPADPSVRREAARTYLLVGELYAKLGQADEAKTVYGEAVALADALAVEFPAVPEHREVLAAGHAGLGDAYRTVGDFRQAEPALRRALDLRQGLADEQPQAGDRRRQLAASHGKLGDLQKRTGNVEGARQSYVRALDLFDQLVKDFPGEPSYRQGLSGAHANLASLLIDLGQFPSAAAASRRSVEELKTLVEAAPAVTDYREELARASNTLSVALQDSGELPAAKESYRETIALLQGLANDFPRIPDHRFALAATRVNYGQLLRSMGQFADAEEEFRQGVGVLEGLATDFPHVLRFRQALAVGHNTLGVLLHQRGVSRKGDTVGPPDPLREAEAAFRRAAAVQEKLAAENPAVPDFRNALGKTLTNLGRLLRMAGRPGDAEDALREALRVLEALTAKYPNPDYRSGLGMALNQMAELQKEAGKLAEARQGLTQAIGHQRAVLQGSPQMVGARHELRGHYWGLADVAARLEDHAGAAAAAEELPKLFPQDGANYHQAAQFLARCTTLAEKDARLTREQRQELASRYAGRAVELLHRAVEQGFRDVENLKSAPDFAPLQQRPDFQRLLAELPAKPKSPPQ